MLFTAAVQAVWVRGSMGLSRQATTSCRNWGSCGMKLLASSCCSMTPPVSHRIWRQCQAVVRHHWLATQACLDPNPDLLLSQQSSWLRPPGLWHLSWLPLLYAQAVNVRYASSVCGAPPVSLCQPGISVPTLVTLAGLVAPRVLRAVVAWTHICMHDPGLGCAHHVRHIHKILYRPLLCLPTHTSTRKVLAPPLLPTTCQ